MLSVSFPWRNEEFVLALDRSLPDRFKVHFDDFRTLLGEFSQQLAGVGDCWPCSILMPPAGCTQSSSQKRFSSEEQQSLQGKILFMLWCKRCCGTTCSVVGFGGTAQCVFCCSCWVSPKIHSASQVSLSIPPPPPACSRKSIHFPRLQKLPPSFGVYFLNTEGNQSFATLNLPFGILILRILILWNRRLRKKLCPSPIPSCPRESDGKVYSWKDILECCLCLIWIKYVNRRASVRGLLAGCPAVRSFWVALQKDACNICSLFLNHL